MKLLPRALWLLVGLAPLAATAHAEVKLGALLKTYAIGIDSPAAVPSGIVTGRFRPDLRWYSRGSSDADSGDENSGEWAAELTYDFVPTLGAQGVSLAQGLPIPQPQACRAWDLDPTVYSGSSSSPSITQNLDRAALTWTHSDWTVVAGRQAIAFGSAKSVNPTDIFAPFSPTALDQEFRVGVDAVRARLSTGGLSGADFGVVAGKDFAAARSGAFARYRLQVAGFDATLSEMAFQENLLSGIDLQHSIGGATARFEGAYVFTGALGGNPSASDYIRLTTGLEYVFSNGLDLFAEYHFNGAGTSSPSGFGAVATGPAYTAGGDYLLGRHYVNVGADYAVSPLLSVGAIEFTDVSGPSASVACHADYSLSEESVIELGTFVAIGARGGQTEFGLYPDAFYSAVKLYF